MTVFRTLKNMAWRINYENGNCFRRWKKVNALYKGFTIKTDQSKENGGNGSAPEPFDMFLTSIGSCAGINVIVFCQSTEVTEIKKKIYNVEK